MKTKLSMDRTELESLIDVLTALLKKSEDKKSSSLLKNFISTAVESLTLPDEAFQELINRLSEYTDGSKIEVNSNFRDDLGISEDFVESPSGLVTVLNRVLKFLLVQHKPGAKIIRIKLDAIDNATTIEDLISLITDNYEISN